LKEIFVAINQNPQRIFFGDLKKWYNLITNPLKTKLQKNKAYISTTKKETLSSKMSISFVNQLIVKIKINTFSSTIANRGDLFVDTNFKNPSISKNLFFNIDAFGTDALNTNPKLKNEGQKPTPYFELNTGSLAIDAGQIIAGITDGFTGTNPDIGAYEMTNLILKNEPEKNDSIIVFPNPNKGHEVILKGIKSKTIIELFTISGLNIPLKQRFIDNETMILDVKDNLMAGVYILLIRDNLTQITKKLIITGE
jgi:hypothetical protein